MGSQQNKITGVVSKVIVSNGISKKTGEPYETRQILISEVSGQYPQSVIVEAFGKRFSAVHEGVIVDCFFNLAANEYNGKYYNRISAWKIVPTEGLVQGQIQGQQDPPQQDPPQPDTQQQESQIPEHGESLEPQGDDLPF